MGELFQLFGGRCGELGYMHAKLLQLYPSLFNPMDYSPPESYVQGILQARILEWVAISFSQEIFPTQGSNSCLFTSPELANGFFTTSTTWEAKNWATAHIFYG